MSKTNNNKGANSKAQSSTKGKKTSAKGESTATADKKTANSNAGRGKFREPVHKAELSKYIGTSNDPAWYLTNRRIVDDVVKISFANQLGVPVNLNNYDQSEYSLHEVVPGICALNMITCPGVANSGKDGVNMALTMVYQIIRERLNTYGPYAPADVGCVVAGIGEVFAMYANILRAFGIVGLYSGYNFYYPEKLLEAGYGFDLYEIDNIRKNSANLRAEFDYAITNATRLFMPLEFSIVARHAWLFSNYFIDEESIKGQLYIHRMAGHHVFDETSYPTGSALVFEDNATTLEGLIRQFSNMVNALITSDSVRQIQADMRNAFDNRNVWKLAYCDPAYVCLPIYSRDVLSQIHNTQIVDPLTFAGLLSAGMSLDITQSVEQNILQWQPSAKLTGLTEASRDRLKSMWAPLTSDKLLNLHWDGHTTEDIVEATRGMQNWSLEFNDDETEATFTLESCGADIVVGVNYFTMNDSFLLQSTVLLGDSVPTSIQAAVASTQFDWAPLMWARIPNVSLESGKAFQIFGDVGNYARVDYANLTLLNRNIMNSMWSVPEFGTIAK